MGLAGSTITAEVLAARGTDRGTDRGQGSAYSPAGTTSRNNVTSNLGERSTHREREAIVSLPPKMQWNRDFPGGAVVKNPPANAGDTVSSPGPGRSHMPRSN